MKIGTKLVLLIAGMLAFSLNTVAQTVNPYWKDGVIYIKLKDNVAVDNSRGSSQKAKQKLSFLQDIETTHEITDVSQPFFTTESDILQRTFKIDFSDKENIYSLIDELKNNPDVEYAEPMPLFYTSSVPDDTYYNKTLTYGSNSVNSSWHLNQIKAEQAWSVTQGSADIVVAIVDNAIWADHPDLSSKIVKKMDVADNDSNTNPPSNTTSAWSHGTHVTGLAAAQTNNNIGVASIGYNISLMAVKVTKNASTNPRSLDAALEGIVWAADNGANIINMSFGATETSQTLQNIINYAYNKGCVLVAAAGNDGKNELNYPAALDHVIAVGSCNENDTKAGTSNYGSWIDVMAPGGYSAAVSNFSILSTVYKTSSSVSNYGVTADYDIMSGTSMSTPIVSGLCGLMLSTSPNLTPGKLTDILKSTCDNIDTENPSYVNQLGAGRINAFSAVSMAQSEIKDLVANFKTSAVEIKTGQSVKFSDLSVGNPISWSWQFEGGYPATSSTKDQVVRYNYPGTYKVTLTVNAGGLTDTEEKTAFIYVADNSTSKWKIQNINIPTPFRAIAQTSIVDQNIAWVLTYDDQVSTDIEEDFALTTNGGETWTAGKISIGNYEVMNISAVSATTAYVAAIKTDANGGGIFKTTDTGATWVQQTTASFNQAASFPNVIHMFNENEGFCQGDPVNGRFELYITQDGGTTWTLVNDANNPVALSGEGGWNGVVAASGNNAWFGTNKGRVFKTADKGVTWEVFDTGAANVNRLSFSDANNGVMLCSSSPWKMFSTADGGETWHEIAVEDQYLSSVSAVPGTAGMLVGIKADRNNFDNCFSAYSLDNGTTWTTIDEGVRYSNIEMYNADYGWAGGINLGVNNRGIYKWPGTDFEEPPTNLVELADNNKIQLYPNPSTDYISISNWNGSKYEIVDITGRVVSAGYLYGEIKTISVSALGKGFFFIRLYENDMKYSVEKFIKL